MASSKEIRNRIATVVSIQKITSAMKMVAAARLRKAQDAILQLRPYARHLQNILNYVASSGEEKKDNVYTIQREAEKILIVIVTSNRGLCGAFNSNATRKAVSVVYDKYSEQLQNGKVQFLAIGKKGYEFLRKRKMPIYEYNSSLVDKPQFSSVAEMVQRLTDLFVTGKFDRIILVYNQFKNPAVQILIEEQFLPVAVSQQRNRLTKGRYHALNYIIEPSQEYVVQELIPKTLRVQFFRMLTDSYAAEQGARMTAMHQATDNAYELLRELRLKYNKARQAAITKEILEIVGGAEAFTK